MSDVLLKKLSRIKAFAFDMDGVLTDGSILCTQDGQQLRTFNIRDQSGIVWALKNGYRICIISGSFNEGAKKGLQTLFKLEDIYMNDNDKVKRLKEWTEKYGIPADEILYMGDDVLDIKPMNLCSIKACPADARQDVLEVADYVSPVKGGEGCVRDVIEKVMKLQNKWNID